MSRRPNDARAAALMRTPELCCSVSAPVLGIGVRFESNSEHVIQEATDRFAGWLTALPPAMACTDHVVVRIMIHDAADGRAVPDQIRHIDLGDGRLVVSSSDCVGIADPLRRESVAHVSRALSMDARFAVEVLEALTFALLAHFDRHPVHAAALVHHDHAILLAGSSGAGKSTLAYLAHSIGIVVLSDDHVWIQQEPALRVWGGPARARLIAGDGQKISHSLAHPGAQSWAASSGVTVCVLARGPEVALQRVDAPVLEQALASQLAPGFDRFPERQTEVARRISVRGGWRLTLSPRPEEALILLRKLVENAAVSG